MNIEDLKKLSEQDALQAAAKFTGVDASVLDGIWRTESARGTAMLSPAGARGHFGLMPKTQALFEKKLGVKIDPNNFHESLFVAANHLKEDLTREGGNVVAALRAYNNGPKWREQRDPRGENAQYAAKVLGTKSEEAPTVIPQSKEEPFPANSNTPMPGPSGSEPKVSTPQLTTALASASFVAGSLVNTPEVNIGEAFASGAAIDLKRQEEIDGLGLLDAARASFMHQGILGNTLKRIERPQFTPVPGYVPPEKELAGRREDDQSFLLEARSPEEFAQLKWELDVEQEDMRRMSLRGPGFAVAAGILSGLPEGFVSGIAAGKVLATAGYGAKAAMESGNAGRAIGMSALENVGGNLVTTAIEDAISGRMSAMDYAVSGAIGLPFTGLAIPGLVKGSAIARQQQMAFKIATEAAEKQAAIAEQAVKNLGDGASAEAIAKEMERIEAAEIRTTLGPDTLGEDRRLIPDMTKLEEEALQAEAKDIANLEDAGKLPTLTSSDLNVVPGKPANVATMPEETLIAAYNAPQHQANAKRYLFGAAKSVDDLRGMQAGLYVHDNVPAETRKVAEWLHKNFLPDQKLFVSLDPTLDANGSYVKMPHNGVGIILKPDAGYSTLIHEVGHGVLIRYFGEAPENIKKSMRDFHAQWLKRYVNEIPAKAEVDSPGTKSPNRLGVAMERSLPDRAARFANSGGKDASLFDVLAGAVDFDGKPKAPSVSGLKQAQNYWGNFDEMSAEQFTKWMEATIRGENSWKPAIIPAELVNWVKKLWADFTSLFKKAKEAGYINADESFKDFFEFARKRAKATNTKNKRVAKGLDPYRDAAEATGMTTDAFSKWFGKSKVVDSDGLPKVYYHGRKTDWTEYDLNKQTWDVRAIFVTPDPKFAEGYTAMSGVGDDSIQPNIMPLYVRAENPFDFENPSHVSALEAKMQKAGLSMEKYSITAGRWTYIEKPYVQEHIRALGFDGFHVKENGTKHLAVYDETQIKSVFNQGTWSNKTRNVLLDAEHASLDPAQQAVADQYGLSLLPVATPAQRAEQKALVAIYAKANNPEAPWNNIDPKWLNTLTAKSHPLGSTGLLMMRSKNPVARMVATELLESTTGAGGRRATASIAKYMAERKYLGNSINGVQDAYKVWRNSQGGSIWEDYVGGTHWEAFNRKVAEEIEGRRTSTPTVSAPAVKQAADILEAAYERMRVDQIAKKTTGWGGLPATSRGYMPHRLSGERVRNMTNAQHQAFHSALVDQFVGIEGWDISFSSNLAAKYIDRAKIRAMGGHDIPANVHHTGAGEVVRDALQAMGMAPNEVRAQMEKFMRGGASHTKARLNLNLLQTFEDNGKTFTLMDLFETDQFTLLRGQAGRVSGEVALSRHGIMGRPGMQLMRRAIADFGDDAGKAQPHEVEAFDQVAAEFLNEPFGDYGGKWMNRAMQANSLARLGGMGFTQFAEYINAATHLGVLKTLSALSGTKRLHAEAKALARGETVNNPILGSIEVFGGAEFGSDAYKMVFPFDNPSLQYQVNGHDTITLADRLLRGGIHAQGKLSAWRAIHSAQQRGVAEQIVHKAVKFIRDGGNDKALADMGIDQGLANQLRADLPRIAKFDSAGNLAQFDITKTENLQAAEAFVQAVHRGTGQIIQGTFIGETGKWAHSGWLRLLTQFRTFSLTSVEKQWARNRNNHGVAQAALMLMGSMSVAWPIYVARQYATSIGREDREAYLEKQLQPEKIARATLNYVASSGLAGDFLDAFAAVTGLTEATGGRAGSTTEFVGTVIAPAAGLADDLWRGIQNSKDGTDVHEVVKNLPFAKLPLLAPAINLMGN